MDKIIVPENPDEDQAAWFAAMAPYLPKEFFGPPVPIDHPLESYKFIILDITDKDNGE